MKSIDNQFVDECKKYKEELMHDIMNELKSNSIPFTVNDCETEIKITNNDKESICSLLQGMVIPKPVLYFIIDVYQVKKDVYIRKKIK